MYTVATWQLADTMDLRFLLWIPRGFVYVAIAAWLATFAGFARSALRTVFRSGVSEC